MNKISQPITYAPTYHLNLIDGSGVEKILTEHGEKIRSHLANLAGLDNERYAPI